MLRALFPRFAIPDRFRPLVSPDAAPAGPEVVRLRWLGVAGFAITYRGTTLLLDPFVSRPGLLRVAAMTLSPDRAAIDRHVPRAQYIVIGHSHYDHLMDAPTVALRDGATIIGSASTARLARAAGVSAGRIVRIGPEGGTAPAGDFEVTLVRSRHGRVLLGKRPFPGEVADSISLPCRSRDYRMGDVYGVLVRAGEVTLYHNGSADLIDEALAEMHADVLLIGLAGGRNTPRYVERLVHTLRPRVLVPMHYDAFFAPLSAGLHLLPGVDVPGFLGEAGVHAPHARVVMPRFLEEVRLPPHGEPYIVAGTGLC